MPEQSDYVARTQRMFTSQNEDEGSVYVLEADKAIYDVHDPQYSQIHCIRFEIERGSSFKITDIDYCLEGNRHVKAHSEELFKDAK